MLSAFELWGLGFGDSDRERLHRLEAKFDLILEHLGEKYTDPTKPESLSDELTMLAADPRKKIQAIKLHRQQTGVGLKGAKRAIDAYLAALKLQR